MMDFPVGPNETTTEWLTPVLQQHRALQRGRWKGESQPMKAMLLHEQCTIRDHSQPLTLAEVPDPVAYRDEVLIQVSACGVCHTELDEIEGRISPTKLPIALGHQVVGRVIASGHGVSTLREGDRVGVAWIFSACGDCQYCARDQENLCMNFRATGRDVDGGYAEFMKVPARYAYRLPDEFSDAEAAPLLCAGAIGYRSLRPFVTS